MTNGSFDVTDLHTILDNDSGHRLAEFLQMRGGGTRRHGPIFADVDSDTTLSFNCVRLEKLQSPPVETTQNEDEILQEQQQKAAEAIASASPPLSSNAKVNKNATSSTSPPVERPRSPSVRSPIRKSGGASVGDRLRRYSLKRLSTISTNGRRTLLKEFENTLSPSEFAPPICSTPQSFRKVSMSVPPTEADNNDDRNVVGQTENLDDAVSDNSAKSDSVMRNLLRQDEELRDLLQKTIVPKEKENQSNCNVQTTPNKQIYSSSLGSSEQRTYTVEKGTQPGQVILTPSHSPMREIHMSSFYSSKPKSVTSKRISIKSNEMLMDIPKAASSFQRVHEYSPRNASRQTNRSQCNQIAPDFLNVPNTPPQSDANMCTENLSHVEIPETQNVETQKLINSLRKSQQTPIIVIPVHQTFNGTPTVENGGGGTVNKSTHTILHAENQTYTTAPTTGRRRSPISNPQSPLPAAKLISEDDLRLADIMTDDEEPALNTITTDNRPPLPLQDAGSSSSPLNLVSSSSVRSTRSRRLRKRSTTRRRLHLDASQLFGNETKTEVGPPKAHPLNLRRSSQRERSTRRKVPLNKAPNTPINGEKFADELKTRLAHMTNNQILDLRKRNSLGRVFPINARKSKKSVVQEQALEEQLQLEEVIQIEILKRTLEGNGQGLQVDTEEETEVEPMPEEHKMKDDDIFDKLPPAPDAFRDDANVTEVATISHPVSKSPIYESSFIDERSCDRISFVPPTQSKNTSVKLSKKKGAKKRKGPPVPEHVQEYLDVSKKIAKHKVFNKSKRSLYNKGQSDSEDTAAANSSLEKENAKRFSDPSSQPPVIPSPPKGNSSGTNAKKIVKHRASNQSKRSLYNKGQSDSEDTAAANSSLEKENAKRFSDPSSQPSVIPSPPKSNSSGTNEMPELRVVSPPPPMTPPSPTRSKRSTVETVPPPPIQFSDDTDTPSDASIFKIPTMPAPKASGRGRPPNKRAAKLSERTHPTSVSNGNDEQSIDNGNTIRRSNRAKAVNTGSAFVRSLYEQVYQKNASNLAKTLERKKEYNSRAQKSLTTMHDNESLPIASSTANSYTAAQFLKTKRNKIQQSPMTSAYSKLGDTDVNSSSSSSVLTPAPRRTRNLTTIIEPISEHEENEHEINGVERAPEPAAPIKKTERKPRKPTKVTKSAKTKHKDLERSRIVLTDTPLNQLNDMFDQLKSASICESQMDNEIPTPNQDTTKQPSNSTKISSSSSCRKLCVRLKRMPNDKSIAAVAPAQKPRPNTPEIERVVSPANTNLDLLSWLKGISVTQENTAENQHIFQSMHFSAGGNLLFTDLQGIDYAFYDTDNKASLGYLRFKSKQIKPAKRAKKYHLHFVVLSGVFKITANKEQGMFSTGDMVAINIGHRYTIENTTNDVGLLMVIKK